VIKDLCD